MKRLPPVRWAGWGKSVRALYNGVVDTRHIGIFSTVDWIYPAKINPPQKS